MNDTITKTSEKLAMNTTTVDRCLTFDISQFNKGVMHVRTMIQDKKTKQVINEFLDETICSLDKENKVLIWLYDKKPVQSGWDEKLTTMITVYKIILEKAIKKHNTSISRNPITPNTSNTVYAKVITNGTVQQNGELQI